jgi:Terpene synthase family 2, C-terminal metal binding
LGQAKRGTPNDVYLQFFDKHFHFRKEVDPLADVGKTKRKAAAEIKAIEATFPGLTDPDIILSMAAWLYFLCALDDVIEEMSPEAAQRALFESISIISKELPERKETPIVETNRAEPLLHCQAQSVHISDLALASRARSLTVSFLQRIQSLLPTQVCSGIYEAVSRVLSAMVAEADFKTAKNTDIDRYLSIRAGSIGVAPFFYFLQHQHGHDGPWPSNLTKLQESIGSIVGMQNDLIGLEKDIQDQYWMNFVLVSAESTGGLGRSIRLASSTHNYWVQEAVKHWSDIIDRGTAPEKAMATEMLAFAERHLRWAMLAKRYKTDPKCNDVDRGVL